MGVFNHVLSLGIGHSYQGHAAMRAGAWFGKDEVVAFASTGWTEEGSAVAGNRPGKSHVVSGTLGRRLPGVRPYSRADQHKNKSYR